MAHETNIAVRFSELDPYKHVNHAVYLNYFEIGRVDALESVDLGVGRLHDIGQQIVVVEITVKYRTPAVYGDRLVVTTQIDEIARASSRCSQQIRRGNVLIAAASLRVAVTDASGRPLRFPEEFTQKLAHLAE